MTLRFPCGPVTVERVREALHYDEETGVFTWRISRPGPANRMSRAGTLQKSGHWRIHLDGHRYLANQLAWLYVTGEWAGCEVDHRDQDAGNDRWSNLRRATRSQNAQNRTRPQGSNPYIGVRADGKGRWRAQIMVGGRTRHLGRFGTAEEASAAYLSAKRELHVPGALTDANK